MLKEDFVEIITKDCPFCDEEHEVERHVQKTTIEIKNDVVEYMEEIFICPITECEDGNSWAPAGIADENLLRARDAYRAKHGLLISDQIIGIRKKYALNQKELSNLLGWGEVTISRYETKQIQEETYDNLLRMVMENPSFALSELVKHKKCYSDERFKEIQATLKSMIKVEGNVSLKRQEILNKYLDYDTECDANGYKLLDIDKVADVIAYFAQHMNNLFKTKLMKLLWYSDVKYYNTYGSSMTGLVYKHQRLGALPLAHSEIIYLPTVNVIEEDYEDVTSFHVVPLDVPINPVFTLEEQDVLTKVALKFRDMTGREISSYMHNEEAYLQTDMMAIIPYSMAESIINF